MSIEPAWLRYYVPNKNHLAKTDERERNQLVYVRGYLQSLLDTGIVETVAISEKTDRTDCFYVKIGLMDLNKYKTIDNKFEKDFDAVMPTPRELEESQVENESQVEYMKQSYV